MYNQQYRTPSHTQLSPIQVPLPQQSPSSPGGMTLSPLHSPYNNQGNLLLPPTQSPGNHPRSPPGLPHPPHLNTNLSPAYAPGTAGGMHVYYTTPTNAAQQQAAAARAGGGHLHPSGQWTSEDHAHVHPPHPPVVSTTTVTTTSTEMHESWKSRLAPLPGFVSRPHLLPPVTRSSAQQQSQAAETAVGKHGSNAIQIKWPSGQVKQINGVGDGKGGSEKKEQQKPPKLALLPPTSLMSETAAGTVAQSHPSPAGSSRDDDIPVLSPISERDEEEEEEESKHGQTIVLKGNVVSPVEVRSPGSAQVRFYSSPNSSRRDIDF